MLDVGTVGFLWWVVVLFQLISIQRQIKQTLQNKTLTKEEQIQYLIFNRMQI
jgi:hypothetical protein